MKVTDIQRCHVMKHSPCEEEELEKKNVIGNQCRQINVKREKM